MGQWCSGCCADDDDQQSGLYEPLLRENEREAVASLLQFLEHRHETNFFASEPLEALNTLVRSDNLELQRSASLAFAEITEKDAREVGREVIEPILQLLQSPDTEVQRASSAALGNLAVNSHNKALIVKLGGVEPLIRQMLSPNVEVQCNAVGCITNLATHEENKIWIARSGALVPLTRLARSPDLRVQRNATGALLNMTHSDENRQLLVAAGAIPILVSLLSSPDIDIEYYCATAISNLAVDAYNRAKLAQTEPKLVLQLVRLLSSNSAKVQCQAALALRNLASDSNYQLDIVQSNGLPTLLQLMKSSYIPLILSSVACIRNISIHPLNESPVVDAGFLRPLVELLTSVDNEEIHCHAVSTLRNLAASSEQNKKQVVAAGAVTRCNDLIRDAPVSVQSEMTACFAVLALSDELKSYLISQGILTSLIELTGSLSAEVQGNSAAAIGNLSSQTGDYHVFIELWTTPAGGMRDYLARFLVSQDDTFSQIAAWTLVQLLDSGDPELKKLVKESSEIMNTLNQHKEDAAASSGDETEETSDEFDELIKRAIQLLSL